MDGDVCRTGKTKLRTVVAAGPHIVHCPSMFSFFGTGNGLWLRVPEVLRRGGNVAMGLDDPGWMNSSDLLREGRLARCMASFMCGAPQLTPQQVLRMLTINGTRALGLGDEVGSLEEGKRGDVVLLDLRGRQVPAT